MRRAGFEPAEENFLPTGLKVRCSNQPCPRRMMQFINCAFTGTRTQNPMIKSHLLCQLSYKSIVVERIKGLEPSTFSLEDWRSANWVIFALKTFSCLWGEFYRKKRLGFFRPTWPTNYTTSLNNRFFVAETGVEPAIFCLWDKHDLYIRFIHPQYYKNQFPFVLTMLFNSRDMEVAALRGIL